MAKPSIHVPFTDAEMSEVERYLERHGGKKATAARKALMDMVRREGAREPAAAEAPRS